MEQHAVSQQRRIKGRKSVLIVSHDSSQIFTQQLGVTLLLECLAKTEREYTDGQRLDAGEIETRDAIDEYKPTLIRFGTAKPLQRPRCQKYFALITHYRSKIDPSEGRHICVLPFFVFDWRKSRLLETRCGCLTQSFKPRRTTISVGLQLAKRCLVTTLCFDRFNHRLSARHGNSRNTILNAGPGDPVVSFLLQFECQL